MRMKKIILIFVIIVVVVGALGALYGRENKKPRYEFITVERSTIVQEVSVTGRVKPSKSVELAFQEGGKIERVYKNVDDDVGEGDILVALNNDELEAGHKEALALVKSREAELLQYKAALQGDEARLRELRLG